MCRDLFAKVIVMTTGFRETMKKRSIGYNWRMTGKKILKSYQTITGTLKESTCIFSAQNTKTGTGWSRTFRRRCSITLKRLTDITTRTPCSGSAVCTKLEEEYPRTMKRRRNGLKKPQRKDRRTRCPAWATSVCLAGVSRRISGKQKNGI